MRDAGDDEAALVTRAQLGDTGAFGEMVRRHLPELHDHLARVLSDPRTTLAKRTFEVALERLGGLGDPHRFRAWLYRLAGEQLLAERRAPAARPPFGVTPAERAVWRAAGQLSLVQARTLDLVVRRGFSPEELAEIVPGSPERHLRRALRRLQDVADDAATTFAAFPAHPPPAADEVVTELLAGWSASPAPPPPPSHHGLVIWGAAVAAVLLSMLVPATIGLFPVQRQASIAPVEYTAAPFVEAAGVATPLPEEPEPDELPSLPPYEIATEDPAPPSPLPPPPSPSPEPTPSPEPEPSPDPSPSPSPSPEPSPDPTCGLLDLPPCESPSESPSP